MPSRSATSVARMDARAAFFLASDDGSFITTVNLRMGGSMTVQ